MSTAPIELQEACPQSTDCLNQVPTTSTLSSTPNRSTPTPQEYSKWFLERDSSLSAIGLCGRFIRGTSDDQLSMLSDEPGKKLSWVCTDELLTAVLGKNPAEAMFHVGFSVDWLEARLKDGTMHRLVVFPTTQCTQATWDNLFLLVEVQYSSSLAGRLALFADGLKTTPYEVIDPLLAIKSLSELPVAEKFSHPEFMTAERFMEIPVSNLSLYHARAFFYHTIGCNLHFQGIPGAVVVPLTVSTEDVAALRDLTNRVKLVT